MALRLAPGHGAALTSLGNTLRAMGRLDEALAAHADAIAAAPEDSPDHAAFRFHRAMALLEAGAFAPGWSDYEWRWRRPGHASRFASAPWRGEALDGRTILLHHEQGLGDTLQFVRYAPMVAERGGRVILESSLRSSVCCARCRAWPKLSRLATRCRRSIATAPC